MVKFIDRTSAPSKSAKWYGDSNPFIGGAYDMFKNNGNCTHYSYSRASELLGRKSNMPSSNAGGWLDKVIANGSYQIGKTPKLGAVAVWKEIGTTTNSGHVANVEDIKSNGDIYCSNSGWKSSLFYMKTYYAKDGYNFTTNGGKKMIFQGFIYLPIEFEEPVIEAKFNLTRLLRKGSKGNDVKELQKYLNANGWRDADLKVLVVDGEFGIKTEIALKKMQAKRKLVADGIVGKNTAESMGWAYNK